MGIQQGENKREWKGRAHYRSRNDVFPDLKLFGRGRGRDRIGGEREMKLGQSQVGKGLVGTAAKKFGLHLQAVEVGREWCQLLRKTWPLLTL